MANKLPKKGDHQPTKYFEGDGKLTNAEKLTEQKINVPQELNGYDIENLCSKFLMNILYYKMANQKKRDQALTIAAKIILEKGSEIQNQLNKNDAELQKEASPKENLTTQTNAQTTAQSNQAAAPSPTSKESPKESPKESHSQESASPKGGKSDIPKISGGTLSEVIAKITEMLAGKSGAALKAGAANLGALVEVLATPEVEKKFAETMTFLAKDPVLVADLKDYLQGTNAAEVFSAAIDKNFSADQKSAVDQVSAGDLSARRVENIASQEVRINQR